ncbi:hypothetical protein JCM17844_23570 [Iodidimonas gelatinilytica]|uniref:NIPSNAP domain-containing protein n=1 Tax=Iodidimonas gelatinilytica TaxID=1236966 RepID=A0A5A7N1D3_9PROT|nr:hypothetical protein [Iodidimonas gelatinilytica]GEQ98720.1 hypothetical protein JCM17844_23570 [Iodidimonas gelatinilytica]GER00866.1 hypothetical protein JCM17845_14890 [Iodidimonas gelatinilytica]
MFRKWIGAVIAPVFLLLSAAVFAQSDAPKREMITELQVDPAHIPAFEEHLKAMFDMAKEAGYPHDTYVAQWRNLYYLVTPIGQYADLDKVFAARGMVWEEGGDAFQDHYNGMQTSLLDSRSWLSRYAEEVSYKPAAGGSPADGDVFMEIDSFSFKLGHWDEVEDMLADVKAIYEELEIPYAYDVYYEGIGMQGNQVTFISYAPDAATMAQRNAEIEAMMKDHAGWMDLLERYFKIAKSSTTMHGIQRRDLTLIADRADQ